MLLLAAVTHQIDARELTDRFQPSWALLPFARDDLPWTNNRVVVVGLARSRHDCRRTGGGTAGEQPDGGEPLRPALSAGDEQAPGPPRSAKPVGLTLEIRLDEAVGGVGYA